MKKFNLILTVLFLSLIFVSCSGSSGGGSDPAPQEEQDPGGTSGGTTGTTSGGTSGGTTGGSTGGTSGGTSGGGSTCLSTNQKENIRSVLNRVVEESGDNATLTIEVGDPGTTDFIGEGDFSLRQSGSNKWAFYGGFCSSEQCADFGEDSAYSFKNGCFYSTVFLAEIRSSLANEFTVTYLFTDEDGIRTRNFETWSVSSSGRVKYQKTKYQDGEKQSREIYQEL